jgi:hypothetical protein
VLVWTLLTALAHAGDCDSPVTADMLEGTLDEALRAYGDLDEVRFTLTAERAEEEVRCLDAVVPRETAAALHRVTGLRWFVSGDADQATASFQAAVAIDPTGLPADIAPAGGKLYKFFEGARATEPAPGVSFSFPRGMAAYVDGARGNERGDGLPTIVQVDDGSGNVLWSQYFASTSAVDIPADVGADAAEDISSLDGLDAPIERKKAPEKEPKPKGEGMNVMPLYIGAGVATGVAAACYGGAAYTRTQFDKEPTQARFNATNGAYYTSVGFGAVAIGLAGVAVAGSF